MKTIMMYANVCLFQCSRICNNTSASCSNNKGKAQLSCGSSIKQKHRGGSLLAIPVAHASGFKKFSSGNYLLQNPRHQGEPSAVHQGPLKPAYTLWFYVRIHPRSLR